MQEISIDKSLVSLDEIDTQEISIGNAPCVV